MQVDDEEEASGTTDTVQEVRHDSTLVAISQNDERATDAYRRKTVKTLSKSSKKAVG